MSPHEKELFKIIYESNNPEQAVMTAITIFAAFLERLAKDQELPAADPLESA